MPTKVFTQEDLYQIGCQGVCREAARRLSTWDSKKHFVPEPWFNPIAGIVASMFKDPLYANATAARKREGNLFFWRNQQADRLGLSDNAGKLLFYCRPRIHQKQTLAKCLFAIADRYDNGGLVMKPDELMKLMRAAGVSENELEDAASMSRRKGHGMA